VYEICITDLIYQTFELSLIYGPESGTFAVNSDQTIHFSGLDSGTFFLKEVSQREL
jgi:hypothetical protein